MKVTVVDDARAAGRIAAERIAGLLGGPAVVGCPAGRTPRTTYATLGALAAERALDLSRLHVIGMDEYVEPHGAGYRYCAADAPHSCRRFAEQELRAVANAGLPDERRLAERHVHFPDPQAPERYEEEIADLGGIDLFLLAAGTSDGHVAFNPPGSSLESRTRIVALAESTRRDNLVTFPSLGTLERVPSFGVTVGLGTVARHARAVLLLLLGAEKRTAFERTLATRAFDPAWPASVVHACASAEIVADQAAGRGYRPSP